MRKFCLFFAVAAVGLPRIGLGWHGARVQQDGLGLEIDPIPVVRDPATPTAVRVRVANHRKTTVSGRVVLKDFVDGWHAVGPGDMPFHLKAGEERAVDFHIASGPPVFSALYPVHAYAELNAPGGRAPALHAVRIFTVRLESKKQSFAAPTHLPAVSLSPNSCLPLWTVKAFRPAWRYFGGPMVWKPLGWQGSDPVSRAYCRIRPVSRGGSVRPSIQLHPAWHPKAGTVYLDFRVTLPREQPLRLTFANAIRNNTEREPPSDGVSFRVWVGRRADGSDAKLVFDRFSRSKYWIPAEVSLDQWAGKTVLLRFESNPGPKHDTTCDLSYWAEPILWAGKVHSPGARLEKRIPAAAARAADRLAKALLEGMHAPDGIRTYLLRSGPHRTAYAVVITPGANGLLDAWFTVRGPEGTIRFHGLELDIEGMPVARRPAVYACSKFSMPARAAGRAGAGQGGVWRHWLYGLGKQRIPLNCRLYAQGGGLRLQVKCPLRITRFSTGPWSRRAKRVFYGHGYCIVDPQAFRAASGGHNLATSHVAEEFPHAPAMLEAVDNPPDAFEVDPDAHVYALITHLDATLTLVPGPTAFAAAVAYRPLYDKSPAAGVSNLAGRFCFDIWGGRYAEIARKMQAMFRYGLTDSLLVVHVWQHWGYDYRLPDVYPPNPGLGTVVDMRSIAAVCRSAGVPWALHDNYIDFYPDAAGFSYRHICFNPGGEPIRAWYNRSQDAQSFRWRPDHILPFVKRNLTVIRKNLAPTAYFLDVLTSLPCFDYWDIRGRFHPATETRRCWGRVFAWIRDSLGNQAPTLSEAGDDQLVGWLDGADCQWLTLSETAAAHTIRLHCRDWERVPWFDAVNHARFVLHGVGYSIRYQGGRSRAFHGINSDDYISAEILSGHALMTDAGSWGRAAVRKYWLAQDVARSLAGQNIRQVDFSGDDIHRLKITWSNGVTAWVNRGKSAWLAADHVLPRYGFFVQLPHGGYAAFQLRKGRFAESSRQGLHWYCNARTQSPSGKRRLRIFPKIEDFRYLGGNEFRWTMVWKAQDSTPEPMKVFVHFRTPDGREIVFQDDHNPPVPTNHWKGIVRIPRIVRVPDKAAGDYPVFTGLYRPQQGRAFLARAKANGIQIATLHVARKAGRVAAITMSFPPKPKPLPPASLNPPGVMVDFGFAVTDGAFRIVPMVQGLRLIPLPKSRPFTVRLRLPELGLGGARPLSVAARPAKTADPPPPSQPVPFHFHQGELEFRTDPGVFAYDITIRRH